MGKSKGKRSKTRKKLRKKVRDRGKLSAQRVIQDFQPGSKVGISIDPSVASGQPHPKFHGKTGRVKERQGRSYVVEIRDGNDIKKVISRPEHLKLVEA
ncbi:50S ribosomal protein L21 [candidate division MSBL1 archaeon SCGC-AAA261O19]|uniref:Large ribosomal subunit protein eL21 n=2 Tax=candidate division MSBL1 TaxID=215777 RepID=A0A133V2J6_9EURY|nr:50S ribosomal protein L21 [candidate division MSBL1 archaeon SCGC-AAA261C02]KXB04988.1 50S ribosomal protein L21 [candidate division MSBL1 archaeon SCGC-AAA261O19]